MESQARCYIAVTYPVAIRLVWQCLDTGHCRPTSADLAAVLGVSERHLRRAQQRHRAARWRELITYGCLLYALREISCGVKVEAAMRLAGFRNRTNFNRQVREYFACRPIEFRNRQVTLPDGFGSER